MEFWHVPSESYNQSPSTTITSTLEQIRPLITVGVPTYKRIDGLKRCLNSLRNQNYHNFHLIISNDDVNTELFSEIVDFDFGKISKITIYNQTRNLGSLGNFKFLYDVSDTEYFMWLADDDEISSTYLDDLLDLLINDSAIVGAMGNWKLMRSGKQGAVIPQIKHASHSSLVRIVKYIWRSDDAFFYGLFRRSALSTAKFPGYVWPNRGFIRNWCYVFQFYIILRGGIAYTDSCTWINHDYGEKLYPASPPAMNRLWNELATIARRANIYALYVNAAVKNSLGNVPITLFICICALGRDALGQAAVNIRRVIRLGKVG